jgi:hypothetical protein
MAYTDPSLIRKHTVKLSFNDNEAALVNAFVQFTGEEKAAFLRALILDRANEVLGGHGSQSAPMVVAMPRTTEAHLAVAY